MIQGVMAVTSKDFAHAIEQSAGPARSNGANMTDMVVPIASHTHLQQCIEPMAPLLQAMCKKAGRPDKMVPDLEALPAELEWGQVLVSLRAVPVSPADVHTIQTGGSYGGSRRQPPFVIGHDGVGVVMQVRSSCSIWPPSVT